MDIKKLNNHVNGKLNGTNATEYSRHTSKTSSAKGQEEVSDKVTIKSSNSHKSEKQFARLELEKLNQSSIDRLKDYKAKISAYQQAKASSPEEAGETEIGQKLNDPDVWSDIAGKILG